MDYHIQSKYLYYSDSLALKIERVKLFQEKVNIKFLDPYLEKEPDQGSIKIGTFIFFIFGSMIQYAKIMRICFTGYMKRIFIKSNINKHLNFYSTIYNLILGTRNTAKPNRGTKRATKPKPNECTKQN